LAFAYTEGRGVRENDAEALKWFRRAADQGNASAQCKAGFMYLVGRGTTQDDNEAVKYFQMSADQGNADGQYLLGIMFRTGKGVIISVCQHNWIGIIVQIL
jgi:uncharacterized protein